MSVDESQTVGEMLSNLSFNCTLKTYDDAVIAPTNKVRSLLSLPYFKLIVEDERDYLIISEKNFSLNNSKYELRGNEKSYYDYCKSSLNLSDRDSVVLSKYCTRLMKRIDKKDEWSKEDYLAQANKELVRIGQISNHERLMLEAQLANLKEHRLPLMLKKLQVE